MFPALIVHRLSSFVTSFHRSHYSIYLVERYRSAIPVLEPLHISHRAHSIKIPLRRSHHRFDNKMPVRLKQWHFAQAPQAFHDALVAFRLEHVHVKALSAYYNNIISDPFPSRSTAYDLQDQIMAAHKNWIAAGDNLDNVSDDIGYFEDPDAMIWITRPDRRRYHYECESVRAEQRKTTQQSVIQLSEMSSHVDNNADIDSDDSNSTIDNDFDSDTNTTFSSQSTTPPSSPPFPSSSPPCTPKQPKKVRFALDTKFHASDHKRMIMRIRTKEEVDEEFEAANTIATRTMNEHTDTDNSKNGRKRKRSYDDDDDFSLERPRKKAKTCHGWGGRWPEAYFSVV